MESLHELYRIGTGPSSSHTMGPRTAAIACAEYALLSDGSHRVSFDRVVQVMKQTGLDLPSLYRETSRGGLAGAAEPRA